MIYLGNGIYSDSTPNEYLQHYGVKGMKWGQHLFSKDPTYFGGQKKKNRSAKQWAENKHRAHVANAEANKRKVNINASVSVNNKTKKLPRTSLGVLMKYDSLNENEYNQAMKNIRRRNEVYDAVINDAYRLHRAVNFAPTVLNDVTKTIKNVDYLSDRLRKHYNSKHPKKQTVLGVEPEYVNVEDQKNGIIANYKAQHSDSLREGNYLEHYGRKGMKWGQHIFGEEDLRNKRIKNFNDLLSKHLPQNTETTPMRWGIRKDDTAKTGMPKIEQNEITALNTRFGSIKMPNKSGFEKIYNEQPTKQNKRLFIDGEYQNSINSCLQKNAISKWDKYKKDVEKVNGREFRKPTSKDDVVAMCRVVSLIDPQTLKSNKLAYSFAGELANHSYGIEPIYDRKGRVSAVSAPSQFGSVTIRGIYGDINDTDFESQLKKKFIPKDLSKLQY